MVQIECGGIARLVSNSMSFGMQRRGRQGGVSGASHGVVASGRRTCRRV